MVEKITIEVSDEIMKWARMGAQYSGRTVEQIILDWLVRGAEHQQNQQLTNDERKGLLEEPSPRREDWYDDEGR
jgi:hypothetical protein